MYAVIESCGKQYKVAEGEAAFYGPKIDIQISWVLAELLLRKGGNIMSKKDFLIFFQTMTIFLLIILLFKTFN